MNFPDEIKSSDNYLGGVTAAKHLIAKGYKKVAHITTGNLKLNMLFNTRCNGFIDTCKSRGIEYIDGVFASSDIIEASVIKYFIQNSKKVSKDVKVVGYERNVSICSGIFYKEHQRGN